MHLLRPTLVFSASSRTPDSIRTAVTCPPHRACPPLLAGMYTAWPDLLRQMRGMRTALTLAKVDTREICVVIQVQQSTAVLGDLETV
jgi:hypothetical protein